MAPEELMKKKRKIICRKFMQRKEMLPTATSEENVLKVELMMKLIDK